MVTNEEISLVPNKHKSLLNKIYEAYHCIRTINVDDNLIEKIRINIQKTILLWRDLKLQVTPSPYLFEDDTLNQMSSIEDDIADKTVDHIELSCQIGKCLERRYKGIIDFTQSQTLQIKLQDLISTPIVEMKSEQVKKKR